MSSNATLTPDVIAEVLPAIAKRRTTRRRMLAEAGTAAGLVAAGTLLARPKAASAALPASYGPKGRRFAVADTDILNFALNLEYLEAEFYQVAATGFALTAGDLSGTGNQGAVTGGSKVAFSSAVISQYANEIAADELNHVRFLRAALGAKAVARPSVDFTNAFTNAARSAGLVDPTAGTFSPFTANSTLLGDVPADFSFLLGAFIFEDVGVTAYQGGAPYIRNPTYLGAAAAILAVEAQHAAEVRTTLFSTAATAGLPALYVAANAISAARNKLSAAVPGTAAVTDEGPAFAGPGAGVTANIVPAAPTGLTYARTFGSVLNIVYLGGYNATASAGAGGFFPNGMNGRIT